MLPLVQHQFVAEILRDRAEPIPAVLDVDWVPAAESGRLECVRRNRAMTTAAFLRTSIAPGWDPAAGAPYVGHLDIQCDGLTKVKQRVPLRYLSEAVSVAVSELIKEGRIAEGDRYTWRVCAYRTDSGPGPAPAAVFQVDVSGDSPEPPLPVVSVADQLAEARYLGPAQQPGDIPVVIAPRVLDEASQIAIAAGTLEAGGILLGRLARDEHDGDLFLEITAQIPAREAIAETASLRFTAETWRAVEAAIRLRRSTEIPLGWWHSHPQSVWPCVSCPPERRSGCPSNRAFFSSQDAGFHRTAFQGAHNIALLLSFLENPAPQFDLFGWRNGMICTRGYYKKGT